MLSSCNLAVIESSKQTKSIANGPSLQLSWDVAYMGVPEEHTEFSVRLQENEDPEFLSISERMALPRDQAESYYAALEGNKLAGTPGFCQGDEFPFALQSCAQVLQLDMTTLPFFIDLGDGGIGHIFADRHNDRARFQYACH